MAPSLRVRLVHAVPCEVALSVQVGKERLDNVVQRAKLSFRTTKSNAIVCAHQSATSFAVLQKSYNYSRTGWPGYALPTRDAPISGQLLTWSGKPSHTVGQRCLALGSDTDSERISA